MIDFRNACTSVASSVTAGVILALLFFFWRGYVFPVPTVDGRWYCLKEAKNSELYRGLDLGWRMILAQGNAGIVGSSEKVWEQCRGTLADKQIDRGRIEGFYRYSFFSKSKLSLHTVIAPHRNRETTASYELTIDDGRLYGTYYWTADDQDGVFSCRREPISWTKPAVRRSVLALSGARKPISRSC